MTIASSPAVRPSNPCFSSGPCAKRPGWTPEVLKDAALGRSHRSSLGKAKLKELLDKSRQILGLPDDYRIGVTPGSDTGAVEMALWSMLGARGVDMVSFESFGATWASDVVNHMKLGDVRTIEAEYGELPDLSKVDTKERDVVFTWNGTTSGVMVPNADWIASDRKGLIFCDATSSAFAMDMDWSKLDVVTWSWQKVLGGEGGHGMIVLSPRAVERLESFTPPWPLPKVFRMTQKGKLIEGIFVGDTINTPSMLAVEDQIDALNWALSVGGAKGLIARAKANLAVLTAWVKKSDWIEFLAKDEKIRSTTSVTFTIKDPVFKKASAEVKEAFVKKMVALLAKEGVAYDIAAHRDAPLGLRIWAGATIEADDLKKLTPWLDWAYAQLRPTLGV